MNMKLMSKSCNKSTLQEEAVDCCALAGFEGELEELDPGMALSSHTHNFKADTSYEGEEFEL